MSFKRYQILVLTFLLFLVCFNGSAQRRSGAFKITGLLIDNQTRLPLEFATISLFSKKDSTLVSGAITDTKGQFTIETRPGRFYAEVGFISYKTKIIKDITLGKEKKTVNLGTITLSADTETLNEVVVKADRNQMQLELDKRVFNVGENINNIGANAVEILDNLPSLAVDVEGNIQLRGNSNVRILVNGKPSGLVGINDQDGLRQLQGDLIERIEVITNPSARYDAEGTAGIINIILKKERQKGFNGGITANLGYPENFGFSGNVNYRAGKFNLFSSYGINYRENPGGGFTDRSSFGGDTVFTFIDNDRVRTGLSHNFRIGTDFYFNDNNILTASGLVRISDEENTTRLTYFDRDANRTLFDNTLREDVEIEDDNNFEYQLAYRRIMKGKGHELNTQIQYRDNDETEDSAIGEADLLAGEGLEANQRSLNIQGDKNVLIQVDYVRPLGKGKKIETGYRGTIREISSDYNVEERDQDGIFRPIEEIFEGFQFSNEFTYEEDVHAAYFIFENKMDQWGYQVGLRAEQTFINTFQREGNISDTKEYLNAFPSAFLTYKLNKKQTVQASYSRRLSRPRFRSLNPFSSFSDPRNIRSGNTDLDPEYTDSYELGLLSNLTKTSWYVGGYYRNTTGVIERVSIPGEFAGNTATIRIPFNIGVEDAYGVEANFSTDPLDWLNINGNANFYRAITEGSFTTSSIDSTGLEVLDVQELDRDAITANFRLNTRIKIADYNLQVSGNYRAPQNTVQGKRKSFYTIDIGANKDILKGKGTLTFSARDILNSRKYRGILETENLIEESEFQWRSRQVRLSFTYRINQKKKRGRRNRDNYDSGEEDF